MKFLKKIKDSKLNFILMLLYPIVTFYLLEWFTHNPWKTMKATPQVLNIIMFELIALLLFAAIGKLHVALMTETLFFFLYGLVNYFVLNFRSVPIQPWDLFPSARRPAWRITTNIRWISRPYLSFSAF